MSRTATQFDVSKDELRDIWPVSMKRKVLFLPPEMSDGFSSCALDASQLHRSDLGDIIAEWAEETEPGALGESATLKLVWMTSAEFTALKEL